MCLGKEAIVFSDGVGIVDRTVGIDIYFFSLRDIFYNIIDRLVDAIQSIVAWH